MKGVPGSIGSGHSEWANRRPTIHRMIADQARHNVAAKQLFDRQECAVVNALAQRDIKKTRRSNEAYRHHAERLQQPPGNHFHAMKVWRRLQGQNGARPLQAERGQNLAFRRKVEPLCPRPDFSMTSLPLSRQNCLQLFFA